MTSSRGIFCVQFFRFNLINVKLKLEHEQRFSTTIWSISFRLSFADWFIHWSHKLCSLWNRSWNVDLLSPPIWSELVWFCSPFSLSCLAESDQSEGFDLTLVKGKRCCFLCVPSDTDSLKWDGLRMFSLTFIVKGNTGNRSEIVFLPSVVFLPD